MKKVLVLGASGSLGRGVIGRLKVSCEVTATYSRNSFFEEGVVIRQVDIKDPKSLDGLGGGFDVVVMIAGAMPATMAGYDPHQYIDTNITGALNVLEFCRKSNIKKIIYVMTFSDVSHKFYTGIPIESDDTRELSLVGDHAVYSISKVAACDLMKHYGQEYDMQPIIFRIPTVYCADDNFNYYVDGLQKEKAYIQMIRSILNNKRIEVWGDPNHAKDMPYIKDFARLIELGVEHPTAQGVFNAGTGDPVPLSSLVEVMIEVFAFGNEIEVIEKPEKPSQPNFTFDMEKTREVFGFYPEWDIKRMMMDIRDNVGVEVLKHE